MSIYMRTENQAVVVEVLKSAKLSTWPKVFYTISRLPIHNGTVFTLLFYSKFFTINSLRVMEAPVMLTQKDKHVTQNHAIFSSRTKLSKLKVEATLL
mgnify:CR=1 FL=1